MVTTETCRMGKRGTMVVPAKLRHLYGLEEGSLMLADATAEGIWLRPATINPKNPELTDSAKRQAAMEAIRSKRQNLGFPSISSAEFQTYRDEGRESSNKWPK